MTSDLREVITKNRVWYCLECGRCSAVCPITHWEAHCYTSPRLFVEKVIQGTLEEILDDHLFWSCLTCKRCSALCPSEVHFSEFMREARHLARADGRSGECTHGGAIQTWGRMMTDPDLQQDRLGWLTDDLKVSADSETAFFVGCLPHYDVLFRDIGIEGLDISKAGIKILNHLGIEPQVLGEERCCGHDQLWQGDFDTFRALAQINMDLFKRNGIKRIVTACPECAYTLKVDYPKFGAVYDLEVLHIAEVFAAGGLRLESDGMRVTFHDPCRLGRFMDVYDAPRNALADAGYELVEMDRSRGSSLCCGTSCWTSCGQVSKQIQVERLQEAKATQAQILVTACAKCQIHFKCAQSDPLLAKDIAIDIRDLTTLIAENL